MAHQVTADELLPLPAALPFVRPLGPCAPTPLPLPDAGGELEPFTLDAGVGIIGPDGVTDSCKALVSVTVRNPKRNERKSRNESAAGSV